MCFRYRGSGFATSGVVPRRFAVNSGVVALAGGSLGEGSFDRPSNTQMEPTRPTVLCDPVTAARGSFATLGRYTRHDADTDDDSKRLSRR